MQFVSKDELKQISNKSVLQSIEDEMMIINDLMAKNIISVEDALDQIKILASSKFDILKQSSN